VRDFSQPLRRRLRSLKEYEQGNDKTGSALKRLLDAGASNQAGLIAVASSCLRVVTAVGVARGSFLEVATD
jgi:hypothetical protein